jgi:L-threonylcarbamoyladenylate synthase
MKKNLSSYLEAIEVLKNECVVIHATDTVFGLSGKYNSSKAFDLIYKLKKRSEAKPLGVLISEFSQIEMFTQVPLSHLNNLSPLLEKGITIILPRKNNLPNHLLEQSDHIGLRIPNHPPTKQIIQTVGPLISTSANLSGSDPICSFEEALPLLQEGVYFLEGSVVKSKIPSTILKYEEGGYSLIREGNVSQQEIIENFPFLLKKTFQFKS